jgi:hypothetical protein
MPGARVIREEGIGRYQAVMGHASRRPLVDPCRPSVSDFAESEAEKLLQIPEADARTRTGDPFIPHRMREALAYCGNVGRFFFLSFVLFAIQAARSASEGLVTK